MRKRRVFTAIACLAATSLYSLVTAAEGAECVTWQFDDPSDFTGRHVVFGNGSVSLEKNRQIGDTWADVSLPVNALESEVLDIEQFSDGCLYASTVNPVSGPDFGVVCKSCDGGVTWSCANLEISGSRRCTKVSRIYQAADGTIYAAGYDYSLTPDNSGVWKSTDDGTTWTLLHALPGSGCTSVVEAADGSLLASTKGGGTVWRCADPVGNPTAWTAVFQTPSIPWGGAPATYPFYPPSVLPACQYLWVNYGENCGGQPYASYPDPYRPDRTQSLFRADDGTLFMSINSGSGSIWSGGVAVRNFGHIYLSTDNGLTWQDSGSWNPPPTTEMNYWGYWNGSTWIQHTHENGSHAADPVPTMQSFPTWVDRIWQDHDGTIYAVTSSGDPFRSWILDPRSDGIVFTYDRVGRVWDALGNLQGTGNFPGTDTYSEHNALYCHDMDEDEISGNLYAATSIQALVNRSSDSGATWDWFMSPRTLFGKIAGGDFFSMEITCGSCLYVGYLGYGEIYASRSGYYDDGYIQNTVGFDYAEILSLFSETTGGDSLGTVTYWISNNGTTWYWWNGSTWAPTTAPAESNPAPVVNANIGSFIRPGSFFFRAFLRPATVHGCPKTPRLVSLQVCATQPTPTPTCTPTVTPIRTPTPAPSPTPCLCLEATVEVSLSEASPGTEIVISVCIPVILPNPVDIYCVVIAPDGHIWSILPGGALRSGLFPIAVGYTNPNCHCGPVLQHTVCRGAFPGEYAVCLGIMPAGMPPDVRKVWSLDWAYVKVSP